MDTGKIDYLEQLAAIDSREKNSIKAPASIQPQESHTENGSPLALPDTDLSATLGAFNTRIQRKKKEHEQKNYVSQQEEKIRHSRILEALMNIRKSMADVARTNLGERFKFDFDVDDWHGWPRICIKLCDGLFPDLEYPNFTVHAHDRNSQATIEIACGGFDKTDQIHLTQESDLLRLPTMLKRNVRAYLDLIADIVIKAEQGNFIEEAGAKILKKKNIADFEMQEKSSHSSKAIEADLYQEDIAKDNMLEALPSLDELEALPSLDSHKKN
jgi:hypothetical protein